MIIMIMLTAFVTDEVWEADMTPFVIKGTICLIETVKANLQWWVLEVFDGFGPHVSSYRAMVKIRYDYKILLLKEEGDLLHVNQAIRHSLSIMVCHSCCCTAPHNTKSFSLWG
jgi:hypothetical protein